MDKTVVALVGLAVVLFLSPLFGIAFGAFTGWVVGLCYPDTLHLLGARMGFPSAEPWQLGAMLGFVGGFFNATLTKSGE